MSSLKIAKLHRIIVGSLTSFTKTRPLGKGQPNTSQLYDINNEIPRYHTANYVIASTPKVRNRINIYDSLFVLHACMNSWSTYPLIDPPYLINAS